MNPRSVAPRLCLLLLPALCLVALTACEPDNDAVVQQDIPFRADGYLDFLRDDGSRITRIAIEIADTDSAQARGLMGRRTLRGGGMLFVEGTPEMKSFWMKNTPLPLDIIFVGADSGIVNLVKRTTPFSEEHINSTDSAQYVVEVRAGFTDRFGIGDDDRIFWKRTE
jgi:uncharacterized membrane protein (UPF0127 family)